MEDCERNGHFLIFIVNVLFDDVSVRCNSLVHDSVQLFVIKAVSKVLINCKVVEFYSKLSYLVTSTDHLSVLN